MNSLLRQRGITMWGMLFVIAVFVFFVVLFIKLYPAHYQNYKVKTALKNLAKQPDAFNMERPEIKAALDRRFTIDDVDQVKLDKHLFIEKKPGIMTIRIENEVKIPLYEGYSVLIEFKNVEQVSAR
jgi:Domain of unknown function (DUF4845)